MYYQIANPHQPDQNNTSHLHQTLDDICQLDHVLLRDEVNPDRAMGRSLRIAQPSPALRHLVTGFGSNISCRMKGYREGPDRLNACEVDSHDSKS